MKNYKFTFRAKKWLDRINTERAERGVKPLSIEEIKVYEWVKEMEGKYAYRFEQDGHPPNTLWMGGRKVNAEDCEIEECTFRRKGFSE